MARHPGFLLLEDGGYLLAEDGSRMLLEGPGPWRIPAPSPEQLAGLTLLLGTMADYGEAKGLPPETKLVGILAAILLLTRR